MSDMTVILRVPLDPAWRAGVRLQVYFDGGTGTVDFNTPLLASPFEVFAGQLPSDGLGQHSLGSRGLGIDVPLHRRIGLGQQRLGVQAMDGGLNVIDVPVTIPAAYGLHRFAIKAIDVDGTVQTAAGVEFAVMVSGTKPLAIADMTFNGFDPSTRRVTFDLVS